MQRARITIRAAYIVFGALLNTLEVAVASQSARRECCGVPFDVAVARKPNNTLSHPEDGAQPSRIIPSCLEAHKSCIANFACRSTLRSVQLLCGQETVACSAPDGASCRAALRALMRFSYYQPTCLCREPHLDAHCTIVRNFVFDHPCLLSGQAADRDFHAAESPRTYGDNSASRSLKTCSESLKRCQSDAECFEAYQEFIQSCNYAGGYCSREKCFRSWERLRTFTFIGCTCNRDNSHVSAACLSVYRFVNENPCMRALTARQETAVPAVVPYRPGRDGSISQVLNGASPMSIFSEVFGPIGSSAEEEDVAEGQVFSVEFSRRRDEDYDDGILLTTPRSSVAQGAKFERQEAEEPEETSSQVVFNLLLAGDSPSFMDTHRSPGDPVPSKAFPPRGNFLSSVDKADDGASLGSSAESSCFATVESCLKMRSCRDPLELYLTSCRRSACYDDVCAAKAQNFFSAAAEPSREYPLERPTSINKGIKNNVKTTGDLVRDVAFCSCPGGDQRCHQVLENLAPVCFVKQSFSDISAPKCHALVQVCREDPSCRATLDNYVHQCGTDPMTGRCLRGSPACLNAALELMRSRMFRTCSCAGVHYADYLACIDWKRILWSNPCVEESRQSYWRPREAILATWDENGMNFADANSVQSHPEAISKSTVTEQNTGDKGPVEVAILANSDFQSSQVGHPQPEGQVHDEDEYDSVSFDATATSMENQRVAYRVRENPQNENRNLGLDDEAPADVSGKNDGVDGVDVVDTDLNEAAPTMGSDESTWAPSEAYDRGRQDASMERKKGYCIVENGDGFTLDAFLSEGEIIRVYDPLTEGRCSEICNCTSEGAVKCRVLGCARKSPCYAPGNQEPTAGYHLGASNDSSVLGNKDERGPCVCSGGKYICAHPPSGINIPRKGTSFLFLGYDSSEELLFRGVMRVSARDAAIGLQDMYDELQIRSLSKVSCTLVPSRTFSADNFVMEIRPTFEASFHAIIAQQDECDTVASTLAAMITNRDRKIVRHPALSLLRVAHLKRYHRRIGNGSRLSINGTDVQQARNPSATWDHQASFSSTFNSATLSVIPDRLALGVTSFATVAFSNYLAKTIAFGVVRLYQFSFHWQRRRTITPILFVAISCWVALGLLGERMIER